MAAKNKPKKPKKSEEKTPRTENEIPQTPANSTAAATSFLDSMEDAEAFSRQAGASIKAALERRKGRDVRFAPQSKLEIDTLPVRSLYLQWAMNSRSLPKGVTNLVGKDKLGKSSFIWWLFGGFIQGGSMCSIMVCEGKPVTPQWSARCLTSDRYRVHKMASSVLAFDVTLLDELHETIEAWAKQMRDPEGGSFVPHALPLVLAADPINKLATQAQAAGISDFAGLNKESQVEIGDRGHMWDRAKWYHDWVNKLLIIQKKYNMHLLISEHQNEDGVGGGGSKMQSFLPQYQKELNHRTKNGGQALNQVTNVQFTFADMGWIYSAGEKVARRIGVKPYKNSYGGVESRICSFAIKPPDVGYVDTDTFLDPGLRWDYTEVEWLAEHGLLGFRKTGKTLAETRFTSKDLGFTGLSLVEAAQVWRSMPNQVVEMLGEKLEIPGYINVYEKIIQQLKPAQTQSSEKPDGGETSSEGAGGV